jgi:hypothetical protein
VAVAAERTGTEGPVLVRCSVCKGLRGVTKRNAAMAGPCRECRAGDVVPLATFHGFWTERFTQAEIEEMALAVWGNAG